jgi:outer membrane protein TolC
MTQLKGALGLRAENADPPVPKQFESTPLDLTSDKILASALAQNNRLKELEFEVRAAEASLMLARKTRLPDFSLGFMADVKMNPTLYRLPGNPGTVSLPMWRDKNAARIAEAQANKRSAEARHSAEQIALTLDFAEKSYLYREATRNLELLDKQLLPKARLSLEVARSGYLASQIDFFNLTDSQRTVLAFELDKIEAATQRELVLTELSLVVQGMSPQGGTMGSRGARSQSPVKKSNTTGM